MNKQAIKMWSELEDRAPVHAVVANVDLVIVRFDDSVSVLYGRCAHRGALMADGHVDGDNLICGVHNWDYRLDTGVSEYNNSETLAKFNAWIEGGQVLVDEDEIAAWARDHPQPYQRDAYQGLYQDPTATADEPHVKFIRQLPGEGLTKLGHHGPASAMGVPRDSLPILRLVSRSSCSERCSSMKLCTAARLKLCWLVACDRRISSASWVSRWRSWLAALMNARVL